MSKIKQNDVKEIGQVYSTTKYSLFKKLNGNRDVQKYAMLKNRIEKDGQISPIVVNSQWEVVDGQHRLTILKELKRPVEFIIKDNADFTSVISMNTANRNWSPVDYLNAYAARGYADYITIKEFLEERPNIKITLALCAAINKRLGSYHTHVLPQFQSGEYTVTSFAKLVNFANFYETLLDETLLKEGVKLQSSLWTLFTAKNFDGQRLIKKINSSDVAKKINLYKSESDVLRELVLTYNSNISEKNSKYIEYYYNARQQMILPDKNTEGLD